VPNKAIRWNLIASQTIPFTVGVGGDEGQLTNCHFMSPKNEGEIMWQELAGILKNLLTITGHAL